MIKEIEKAKVIPIIPAKRCPDFEPDCVDVKDHYSCWNNWMLGVADGYCPYLIGMIEESAEISKEAFDNLGKKVTK